LCNVYLVVDYYFKPLVSNFLVKYRQVFQATVAVVCNAVCNVNKTWSMDHLNSRTNNNHGKYLPLCCQDSNFHSEDCSKQSIVIIIPSVISRCLLGGRKGTRPVKK